jgi:hypothetical protein
MQKYTHSPVRSYSHRHLHSLIPVPTDFHTRQGLEPGRLRDHHPRGETLCHLAKPVLACGPAGDLPPRSTMTHPPDVKHVLIIGPRKNAGGWPPRAPLPPQRGLFHPRVTVAIGVLSRSRVLSPQRVEAGAAASGSRMHESRVREEYDAQRTGGKQGSSDIAKICDAGAVRVGPSPTLCQKTLSEGWGCAPFPKRRGS